MSGFKRAIRAMVITLSGMAADAVEPHDHALVARISAAIRDWRKEEDARIARAKKEGAAA